MTGSNSYRIRQGDTLSAIARRNNTTVDALARANNLQSPDRIIAGKTLVIPGANDGFEANAPRPMPRPANRPTGTSQNRDSFEPGSAQGTVAQGVTPAGTAGVSGTQNGYRNVDLTAFRQGGSNSESAIVVGTSEGNRTPNGGFTASYGGHTDPGNAKHNRGSFSYQGAARTPRRMRTKSGTASWAASRRSTSAPPSARAWTRTTRCWPPPSTTCTRSRPARRRTSSTASCPGWRRTRVA